MSPFELLKRQHRELEHLFDQVQSRTRAARRVRRRAFERLADEFAVHCAIEERLFYPTLLRGSTEDLLLKSAEEHLSAKRIVADLLVLDPGHTTWDAKVEVLRDQVLFHAAEEEQILFPRARYLLDDQQAANLGEDLERLASRVSSRDPRRDLANQVFAANPIE